MSEKLHIFVSGKEIELDDERATALDVVESLGFTPIGSENRSASSDSVEKEFLGEVESSEIYIGIFGKKYSDPTIKEFNTARERGLVTLVFEKDLDSQERDVQLKQFLDKIKHPTSGLYSIKYNNVVDLRIKIISGLSRELTKKFKIAKELSLQKNQQDNVQLIESSEEKDDTLVEKMKTFPFAIRFSEDFGKSEFVNFEIISTLKKGALHVVSAKIKGSTKNGFLDLALRTPDGNYLWFPDPNSYDSPSDNGNLCLDNREYQNHWEFSIPDKHGTYLAIMGLYENNFANREIVNFEIKELII